MTLIFAHRGSKGTHPENTLAAFQEAAAVGSDGIELDVHLSKDGQLVVIHDELVDRTTNGQGYIKDKTVAEIKALDAGGWFSSEFQGETIPTFDEVLSLLDRMLFNGYLNIEIKTDKLDYPGIEQLVSERMTRREWSFIYFYSSFNFDTLKKMQALEPVTPKAMIMSTSQKKVSLARSTDWIDALHPSIDWVKEAKGQFSKKLRPWTVNSKEDMMYCFEHQLAGIHTDFPEKAIALRQQLSSI